MPSLLSQRRSLLLLLLGSFLLLLPVIVARAGALSTPVRADLPASGEQASALHLIQFSGPIRQDWLTAVQDTGAQPLHYVADYGYLVWADAAARRRLDALAASTAFLQGTTPYSANTHQPAALFAAEPDTPVEITIQMLRHEGQGASQARIEALALQLLSAWEPVMAFQNLRAVVRTGDIPQIAALPDVLLVENFQPPQLLDERQAQTLAGNLKADRSGPQGRGYLAWLQSRGFSDDPAVYPVVDIVDDGIGNGVATQAGGDVTFRVGGASGSASRVTYIADCTGTADGSGLEGHGHLNASIAGGFDNRAGNAFRDAEDYQYGLGINPYGRLASSRVFGDFGFDLSECGGNYLPAIRQSYTKGARIISNSWGCASCAGTYNTASQAYDAAVRDANSSAPGDQALLAIFSAGNAGSDSHTVGSPADGKNVISVGAVENQRPSWSDGCGYGAFEADNVQDIADYSSRGPSSGDRVKPDLVAPGTHVTGTASTSPFYNGLGICDTYYPGGQQLFAASTGTSHSAPAVAGAASLATWWLQNKQSIANPSPALLKAFLLANTSHVTGTAADDDLPSTVQGYGLLDLGQAFSNRKMLLFDQSPQRLLNDSGELWVEKVYPAVAGEPLKILLAYTDQPGLVCIDSQGCFPQVNDLDLVVRAGAQTYRGNNMSGPWSVAGGEPDRLNNVEAVFLPPGTTVNTLTIEVRGFNIAGDGVPNAGDSTDQDFALVCTNCRAAPIDWKYHTLMPVLFAATGP